MILRILLPFFMFLALVNISPIKALSEKNLYLATGPSPESSLSDPNRSCATEWASYLAAQKKYDAANHNLNLASRGYKICLNQNYRSIKERDAACLRYLIEVHKWERISNSRYYLMERRFNEWKSCHY